MREYGGYGVVLVLEVVLLVWSIWGSRLVFVVSFVILGYVFFIRS